ncbi:MAG: hypothetical protein ACLUOI_39250 [Eisenbergiella sp.]
MDARELFHHIAETNWDYAEPGALFWDRIVGICWPIRKNFLMRASIPARKSRFRPRQLPLGSINLSEFVKIRLHGAVFDFDDFKNCVKESVRALNEVLDEGLPRIRRSRGER